jgi:lipase chaperone LimK
MIGNMRVWLCNAIVAAGLLSGCEGEVRELADAPRSLEGTVIDGRFVFDAAGELVLDAGAQRAFDYFLSADGELTADELDSWVAEQLLENLGEQVGDGRAHEQVMAAWSAYRMFRAEAAAVLEDPRVAAQPDAVERRLLDVIDRHLKDTPLAASERERIEQGFALQRAYAIADPSVRTAELARLSASETQRFADSRAGRYLAGREAIEQARLAQADAETIVALREQHFDAIEPGAAARLAALDHKRAAWTRRMDTYQRAREQLLQRHVGSPAELEAAIARLEADHFSAAERRRVRALERMTDDSE